MRKQGEDISFLPPIREFPDRGTKWLLEFGENVEGLLQIVASDLADQLDFDQLQQVNQSFIPDNLRKQESDIIYLVPFRFEELGDVWVYLLIEHQSVPSPVMGFRILFYMVNIWDAQRRGWEDAKVPESEWHFRPIIPIVFYTGSQTWEMPITMEVVTDLPQALGRFIPTFDVLFLNVKGEDVPDFLHQGHPFRVLLELIRQEDATKVDFEAVLRQVVQVLRELPEESPQWSRAMYYLVLLIYHRRPTDEREALMDVVAQTLVERRQIEEVQDMTQTIAEYFIQEGEERGEKRGEKRGELRAKREAVLKLLQLRFDSIPPSVAKKIKSIRRVDRLNALFDQAATAKSISEIEIN
jgi:predicted transposase/invertase (TIGR01784 family)